MKQQGDIKLAKRLKDHLTKNLIRNILNQRWWVGERMRELNILREEVASAAIEARRKKPRYTHDCRKCIFLSRWLHYDLYYCPPPTHTAVARYGDDGPDYISWDVGSNHKIHSVPGLENAFNKRWEKMK